MPRGGFPKKVTAYRIRCTIEGISEDPRECYVGSTAQKLNNRLLGHKGAARMPNRKNMILYLKTDEWGWENFKVEPLEERRVKSYQEQMILEREWFDRIRPRWCKRKPYVTEGEKSEGKRRYYRENKEKCLEQRKEWGRVHREELNRWRRLYREKNKEKYSAYMKEFYKNNKEKYSAWHKAYYAKTREALLEKNKRDKENGQFRCDLCGKNYGTGTHLNRHFESKMHKRNTASDDE